MERSIPTIAPSLSRQLDDSRSGPLRVPDSPEAALQNHVAAGPPHTPIVSASAYLAFVERQVTAFSEGANPCL